MAIINKSLSAQKNKLKIEIGTEILEQIKSYCQWSDIDSIDYFFEEAACFVFAKDKDWKANQKAIKRARKNKEAKTA